MQFGLGFSILCVYKMNTYAINIQLHWELMVLLKVFHPAGQERDGCYFLNDQKGTKESLGAASGEHLACGGAHSHCPQTPIYGSVSLRVYVCSRRAKSRSVPVLLSAHWGLLPSKFDGIATLTYTASCIPTCLVRQWSGGERRVPEYGPTATAFLHQAVSFQRYFFQISNM